MMYSKSQQSVQELPKLEEWAVINKHKASEFEQFKTLEKLEHYQKMKKFKEGLDDQIKKKANNKQIEKEKDQYYHEYAKMRSKEFNENEEISKKEKIQKRKKLEEENNKIAEEVAHSRAKSNSYTPYLEIGVKSENQRKLMEEVKKREMMEGLERQVKEKNQNSMKQKIQSYKLGIEHQINQPNQFNHIERIKSKSYKQNERAFQNYQKILLQKQIQRAEFQRKMIQQAAKNKIQQEKRKQNSENRKKAERSLDMLDSLEEQVKIYHYKKAQDKRVNPEQANYSFISNVFKEKPSTYDKNKYYEDLRKQAQEQRLKKKRESYMSDQQYKLNRNQLNKIVNGNYAHPEYLDRSLGAIGDKKSVNNVINQDDENSSFIKNRLQNIKNEYQSPVRKYQNQYN